MKLPKVESLIIIVFFACVALWAISKCSSERSELLRNTREAIEEEEDDDERPERRDTVAVPPPVNVQNPAAQMQQQTAPPLPAGGVATQAPGMRPERPALSTEPAAPTTAAAKTSTLYVTINGLNVRSEPGLKGALVTKLDLYEPVTFLGQKTEWTQEISLGYEKVTDHWVKVRTRSGKEGWVFGAGVHYYKMKRKGVME